MRRPSRFDYRIIVISFSIALIFGAAAAWLTTIL